MRRIVVVAAIAGIAMSASAGEADVVDFDVRRAADGTWAFDVTVRHADTGWDHYADVWEVLAPDGTVLAIRKLYHPHVEEQPFMRTLNGVQIPDGIDEVRLRAHDRVHAYGGAEMQVRLPH